MARRAGKAASRKARQRYQPRTPRPAPTPAPEAVSADVPEVSTTTAAEPARRSAPVAYATAGSTLSTRERAEYHYVERDLRNIGILTLVMLIVLVAAWFVFNGLGLIG
jgi:hypothetical protein